MPNFTVKEYADHTPRKAISVEKASAFASEKSQIRFKDSGVTDLLSSTGKETKLRFQLQEISVSI